MLKSRTMCYQVVEYVDLEDLVKEVTGHEWSFVAAEETHNDTQHAFTVSGTFWDRAYSRSHPGKSYRESHLPGLSPRDAKTMHRWLTCAATEYPEYPHGQLMLEWLVINGHIQPGNYLVKVSW